MGSLASGIRELLVEHRIGLPARVAPGSKITLPGFEADAETETMLLGAIAQCQRGQTTPLKDLLAEMRSRE